MKRIQLICSFLIILICFCVAKTFAQAELDESFDQNRANRAESAVKTLVESHRFRLGAFRIRPSFFVNSGYDSNALYQEQVEIGDYFLNAVPGASVGLKLGEETFIRLIEELHFIYYKDLDQRRDIFNSTRGEVVTGSRRLLLIFDGGYQKSKYPFDEEIDIPVDQEVTDGGAQMEYTLSRRVDVRGMVKARRVNLQVDPEINDLSLPLNDRDEITFGPGIDYRLKKDLDLTGDAIIGQSKSIESDITTHFWGVLAGLHFSNRRLNGRFNVGYGESDSGESTGRQDFLINADVRFLLGKNLRLGAFAYRQYRSSAFLDNALRLTTVAGLEASIPLTGRLSISGSYAFGSNDYGDNLVGGEEIKVDNFQTGDVGLNIGIVHGLYVRFGATYLKRNTDIIGLRKEQFNYLVGLGYSLN